MCCVCFVFYALLMSIVLSCMFLSCNKWKKKRKTPLGPHLYAEAVQFADADLFWCLVSTFTIVVHNMSLGVFRRHKTRFPVQEDIRWQRSSQPLLLTSGVKHGRRLGLHAATRLPANRVWLLIIGHVAQFARRNKKEEESHSSQMRQTGTGAEIDANVQLAMWLFSWATKGTNGKGFERGDIGSNQSGQELLLNVKRLLFFPFSYSSLWTQPTTTPCLFFLWCEWCY